MFCHAVFLEAAVFEKSEPPFHFGIILIVNGGIKEVLPFCCYIFIHSCEAMAAYTLKRNTINRNFIMSIQFRPFTLC